MNKKLKRKIWKNRKRIAIVSIIAVCFLGIMFAGCGKEKKGSKVVFTKGLEKDEVFRIGDEICKVSEMMVFLTTTQSEYEAVYGSRIWDTSLNGVTLEDNVKENVLEKVAQIKSMYLLAKKRGVELDQQEKSYAQAAAKDYLGHLPSTFKEQIGISEDQVRDLYEEYALAHKVYLQVIEEVNPEISDDEARIVTVQHILIRTSTRDSQGNKVDYQTAQKQEQYEKACEVWTEATSGKKSFEELASQYSQDSQLTYSFGKGEMDPAFETAAFQLETGEISSVVESESGYHIIKCMNTFDQNETMENKQRLLEERRNEIFGQEYDAFVDTLARKLNQTAWNSVKLIRDGSLPAVDFFETYEKFFAER